MAQGYRLMVRRLGVLVLCIGVMLAGCRPGLDHVAPLEPEETTAAPPAEATTPGAEPPTTEPTEGEPTEPGSTPPPDEPGTPPAEVAQPLAATTDAVRAAFEERGIAFETWGYSRGFPQHLGGSDDYSTAVRLVGMPDALLAASVATSFAPDSPQDFIRKSDYVFSLLSLTLPDWEEGAEWLAAQIRAGLEDEDGAYRAQITAQGAALTLTVSQWEDTVGLDLAIEGPDPGYPVAEGLTLRYATLDEKEEALNLSLLVYWPSLYSEAADDAAIRPFNTYVAQAISGEIAAIRDGLDGEAVPDPGGMIHVDYRVTYASETLLSLLFEIGYYTGGAHPNSYSVVVNYDLREGRVLGLDDVFGEGYLEALAEYSQQDLQARGRLEFPEGAEASAENYASWNITAEGILITFDAYQVGPYAMGPQAVTVPYSTLQPFILAEGPLAAFVE